MNRSTAACESSPRREIGEIDGRVLTKRERQIVELLVEALTNKEIAERLAVSEHTVKVQLGKLYAKVGAKGRLELVMRILKG